MAEARQVERDAAGVAGQELHGATPVVPGAAEPVQEEDRGAGAGLGARDHAARDFHPQRAERPLLRQRGARRGFGRLSGNGP